MLVIAILGLVIGIIGANLGWFNKSKNAQNNAIISENESDSEKNIVTNNDITTENDNNKDNGKNKNAISDNTVNNVKDNGNVNKSNIKKIDMYIQ